jgi:putative peptidoglycan lipid II flippase
LFFISLVALLSGVLNSLNRFAMAAFVPALLNVALIAALLLSPDGNTPAEKLTIVRYLALAVLTGGILQFALCWVSVRRAGVKLHFGRPKMTPAVKELLLLILPATAAAGVYQFSQLFYIYFGSQIGEGALASFGYADRLNQLPLSIIGTALGVAILPSISRAIERNARAEAEDIQARAFELGLLLTIPATLALAVAAQPIIGAIYERGQFTNDDTRIVGNILALLVTGLPAFVLVKVVQPAFYARKDVKTPVSVATAMILLSIPANFLLIPYIGIYSLPAVASAQSWIQFLVLFGILMTRGHFRIPGWLASRVARQAIAALCMVAVIYGIQIVLAEWFAGATVRKLAGLVVLVGLGLVVYFGVAWVIGGIDKQALADLRRRKAPQ